MRVLVACEFSGVVRESFRAAGHDAWSCDFLPAADGSEFHIQGDALQQAYRGRDWFHPFWDLMVAHPPCTYLAVSGARWWKEREKEQLAALQFVHSLMNCWIPKVAIENPVGKISTHFRKPNQIIQPWMFGHGETKATCLWLKELPQLVPTNIVEGRKPRVHHESPGIKNGLTRQQRRSITLQGIADAMAQQWGEALDTEKAA